MKTWFKKHYDHIIIVLIYGLLHFFMHTNYWDDIHAAEILKINDFNMLKYLNSTWLLWSSRLFIHAALAIFGYLPNIIWKIVDVIMIDIAYTYFNKSIALLVPHRKGIRLWSALFFLSFPYSLFATAGWMTTTIFNTWVFATFFYGLYIFIFAYQGNNIKRRTYVFYFFALLYSLNYSTTTVSFLIIILLLFLTCKNKTKTFKTVFLVGMVATLFNLILFICCPGNQVRNISDAANHGTYDMLELSFTGYLRMGINSTFYHFASVPNIILFTFCLMLIICTWQKTSNKPIRSLSCIPMLLDVFWTGYIFFCYTIPNRRLTYIYPDASFRTCPMLEQYCVMASAIVLILIACYLLIYLTDFTQISWILLGHLLAIGLLPEIALGFTTTVSASIIRVAAFLYFSFMFCIQILMNSFDLFKIKLYKYLFYTLGILGTILNILQIIRHILVYG